jgi:hypothetical protein
MLASESFQRSIFEHYTYFLFRYRGEAAMKHDGRGTNSTQIYGMLYESWIGKLVARHG